MLDQLQSALSGRYTIERELGRGGMATVFLAQDLKHHRQVAIKVLSPEIAQQIGAERFEREIRLAARLMHPHILPLHDSGKAGDLLYYVMPYVEGESLRDRLRREVQLSVEDSVRIATQVADALDHAHRHEMVHRDIKPENIMLSGGHAIVADFGVARVTGDAATGEAAGESITQAGTAVGTPLYMSPEQASGSPNQDGRTDQYALACVLYEMLTGQPPYTGATTQAILRQHISATVPTPSTVRTATPAPVEQAITRALSKTPADRFATVGDFGRAIAPGASTHVPAATSAATQAVTTPVVTAQPSSPAAMPGSASGDPFAAASGTPGRGTTTGGAMPAGWTPHGQSTVTPGETAPPARRLIGGPALIAVGAVVVFAVLAWFVIKRPADAPMGAAVATTEGSRLVVLPFENLGSADDEYFADGITEEITSRLSSLDGIGVIARTSAVQYKDSDKSVQDIGQELGVQYILEGTVRWDKSGGQSRVRVTPQLIRVADATQMWADRYDAVLAEVFTVQSQIATEVTEALGGRLLDSDAEVVAAPPTENLEAYDAYLRAMAHADRPNDADSVREAVALFEKAVELDPEFAMAWAKLSMTHNVMQWYGHEPGPAHIEKARETAEAARRLAPDLGEVHKALGFLHYWGSRDYEKALGEFQGSLESQPNDAETWGAIGAVYRRQARWDEAVEAEAKAFELDPRSARQAWETGFTMMAVRHYTEGERYADRGLAIAPSDLDLLGLKSWAQHAAHDDSAASLATMERAIELHGWEAVLAAAGPGSAAGLRDVLGPHVSMNATRPDVWLPLGEYYEAVGDVEKARACFRKAVEYTRSVVDQSGSPLFMIGLAMARSGLGEHDKAIEIGREAMSDLPRSRDALYGPLIEAGLVMVYMRAGRHEDAIPLIENLMLEPSFLGPQDVVADPRLAPVVDHPRVQAAMKNAYRWRPRS